MRQFVIALVLLSLGKSERKVSSLLVGPHVHVELEHVLWVLVFLRQCHADLQNKEKVSPLVRHQLGQEGTSTIFWRAGGVDPQLPVESGR